MKRITYWPQVVLGFAFNWGALVGWTSINGSISYAALSLYTGGIMWTLAYDTIYAHQDKEDDVLIGVKSTALKFEGATPKWLTIFFAAAIFVIDLSFWLVDAPLLSHIGIAGSAFHAAWQVRYFDGDNPSLCLKLFHSNRMLGLLVLTGLFMGCILK
jgi:4-hydroxybenzoate polyprenyltransferase